MTEATMTTEFPDSVDEEEYRDLAAQLAVARVMTIMSPDEISLTHTDKKPTEVAASHSADQLDLYHEMYDVPTLSTDDLDLTERAWGTLKEGVPDTDFFKQNLQQDIRLAAKLLDEHGPYEIQTLIDSTEKISPE